MYTYEKLSSNHTNPRIPLPQNDQKPHLFITPGALVKPLVKIYHTPIFISPIKGYPKKKDDKKKVDILLRFIEFSVAHSNQRGTRTMMVVQ